MSSAAYLRSRSPISLEEWEDFCAEHEIRYSPNTVGQNTYYFGEVEVRFGDSRYQDDLPRLFRIPTPPPQEAGERGNAVRVTPGMVFSGFYDEVMDYGDGIPTLRGETDFDAARPYPTADKITVSSYQGSNLSEIADVVAEIARQWPCEVRSDSELVSRLEKRGITLAQDEEDDE